MASTLGANVLLRRQIGVRGSRKTTSHILERIPILGRTRLWLNEPLEKVHTSIVLALKVREGPITQETALCLMVATGHPFEVIAATYHQPSIAGDVAGPSSNTRWSFQQLWRK